MPLSLGLVVLVSLFLCFLLVFFLFLFVCAVFCFLCLVFAPVSPCGMASGDLTPRVFEAVQSQLLLQ